VKAVILAAGRGRRLGPFTDRHPKCLLRFGGESLLQRHLRLLAASGIEEITVVAGYLAELVRAEVSASACSAPVRVVLNPLFDRGSALSVLSAGDVFASSACLLMDADLLYAEEVLERLLRAGSPNCLLVDGALDDSGEEVKVVVDPNGRPCKLGKSVRPGDLVAGESIGIFRFDWPAGRLLVDRLRALSQADPDAEYEMAIDALMREVELAPLRADGLPWIEIDFPEDVERAGAHIYPRLGRQR
jgi:choline kinase